MNKEYTNIDNLFKEKFENFSPEPPKEAWANISKEISASHGGGMFIKLSLIPFIAASLFLFFTYPHHETIDKDHWKNIDNNTVVVKTPTSKSNTTLNSQSEVNTDSKTINKTISHTEPSSAASHAKSLLPKKRKTGLSKVFKNIFNSNSPQQNLTNNESREDYMLTPFKYRKNVEFITGRKHSTIFNKSAAKIKPSSNFNNSNTNTFWNEKGEWIVGISWNPELVVYDQSIQFGQNGQSVNQQHNFYFTGQYVKKNYFIESGIGYGKVVDRTSIQADYKKYLGSWEDIVNVTFDTNAVGDIEPRFHTETVKVYDTVNHVQYSDVKNYYDYLQVPLYIGRKQNMGRIQVTVKAGVIYSHIINSVIKQDKIQLAENDVLVNSQIQVPQRNKSQLQFATGGGIEYKITEHLNFSFEVFYKKNINQSFSTERKISKPNSFGAKTGIFYKW